LEGLRPIFLDIETSGTDPSTHQLVIIGLKPLNDKSELIEAYYRESEALKSAMSVLKKFDIIAGWNILAFDLPFLMARALKHRVDYSFILEKYVLDLKTTVSKLFVQPQARTPGLDTFLKFIGIERKIKYTGMDVPSLLIKILQGDKEALRIVREHCIEDLEMCERVYGILKPYCNKLPLKTMIDTP